MMLVLGVCYPTNNVTEDELGVEEQVSEVVVQEPSYRERLDQMASRGEIRVERMEITAYNATTKQCGNDLGITASGKKVQEGRTIATHTSIPLGTKVYIEDVGEFVVEDRGNLRENEVDVFMEDENEAWKFGRQEKKIYILGSEKLD